MLQWGYDFRDKAPAIATAFNITIFYLEGILYGMSFISLLSPRYITRHQMRGDFTRWLLCIVMLWSATLWTNGMLRNVLQAVAATWFVIDAVRITIIFFKSYRRALHKVDNYYADNVDVFVRWLYKSAYGIIFFGLTSAVVAFCPKWVIAIQMTAGIFMFLYIFVSFMNYVLNYKAVETAVEDDPLTSFATRAEQSADRGSYKEEREKEDIYTALLDDERLQKAIDDWIATEGYREKGLTIESLTAVLGSNRTYLSSYINSRMGCSFREWINRLRIENSQRVIREKPRFPLLNWLPTKALRPTPTLDVYSLRWWACRLPNGGGS